MNEVMTLAEDKQLNIWYQDTDSMHINYEDVEVLAKEFKYKYNRDLIGNDMGSFHVDFDLEGAEKEIYSIESYFIAKKVYIDILESKDKDNNIINGAHMRLKAVPKTCLTHFSEINKISNIDMYREMYNGQELEFDLTEEGTKCGFVYTNEMSVRGYQSNDATTRRIKFPTNIERIEIT